jgi:5'-nucleotidase/UDP-sugar diphosphatase
MNTDDVVRVGVFGVCTQYTPVLSDPGETVVFEDVLEHARRCVDILIAKKCDFIIGLTHIELENDKILAENLDIDIIIGGHEHTPFHIDHSGKR